MSKFLSVIAVLMAFAVQAQDNGIALKGGELFGGLRARHIGPALMSGRIIDMEVHPTNSKVIYTGTAGGGVWKSVNGGTSYTPIFDDHAQSIGKVKLDPSNPDKVIWVGTGEIWTRNSVSVGDGLYKSTDGGVNWKRVGFEKSERIASIEIHPTNSNIMYVGVLGALWNDSEERGVYKSTDGGVTWEKVLYIDQTTGCADVIMDPNNPDILYASMWEFRRTGWSFNSGGEKSALYKSTDGGKTWNKIHGGFPPGKLGRIAVAVAPSNSNILYSVLETEDETKRGLYRSDDAGKNWKHLNADFGLVVRPFYFSRINIDPKDPDVVVKAGLFGSISRDGGNTFTNMGAMHADIHDMAFNIENSDIMYVGTDGGVYRSFDGGVTLEICRNLPLSQFYHIAVDNREPYNVYGGLQDNGSWYGPNTSPAGVEAGDWVSVGFGDGFRVLPHPTKPIVYSEMQGAERIWRFDMERRTTREIQPLPSKDDPKLRFNWNAPLTTSVHAPDRLYTGSQFVHVSNDMGNSWKIISPDLTTNDKSKQNQEESGGISKDNSGAENHCTIFTITESPKSDKVIWVGTDDGNVQVTRDGGKTWTNTVKNMEGLPENTWCYHIEASVHGEGTAYAVFDGHTTGDWTPYVYKTTDYGATWTNISGSGIKGFVRNIQEDYVNEDLLFVGGEFGLFITVDGGQHWNQFTNNVPPTAIHFLDLQAQTNDLVMGTHGRGVIILDDISPLREINKEVINKELHFFKSKPAIIEEASGFGGTAKEIEFVGENPSNDAKIVYFMKKKHLFGKMTLEIQDMQGNKLTELTPGKSKGVNLVTWNGLTSQPKMAKGKTLSFGGFTSPRVQAGDYKVVIKKGKNTFETTITLKNDPNSSLTDAERQSNHETTMTLFDMSEDLAYMVYELDEILAQAESINNGAGAKTAAPVIKELNALKKTLVITTGDNYVGAAEPELREKIGNLYSKIAGSFAPPSSSELANLASLQERFDKAKVDFAKIKDKRVAKMNAYLTANELAPVSIKSKEEFLK